MEELIKDIGCSVVYVVFGGSMIALVTLFLEQLTSF